MRGQWSGDVDLNDGKLNLLQEQCECVGEGVYIHIDQTYPIL